MDNTRDSNILATPSPDPGNQSEQPGSSLHDVESTPGLHHISAEPSHQASQGAGAPPNNGARNPRARASHRKDKNRVHSMRHGVLSRYPLESLTRLGENIRTLRNFERALRKELNPSGLLGALVFDRSWSSYLRCLLAARADASVFNPVDRHGEIPGHASAIIDGELPTLVSVEESQANPLFSPELFKQLALVAKYDRHFSREMSRALAVLLATKSQDQGAIERYLRQALPGIDRSEGSVDD